MFISNIERASFVYFNKSIKKNVMCLFVLSLSLSLQVSLQISLFLIVTFTLLTHNPLSQPFLSGPVLNRLCQGMMKIK